MDQLIETLECLTIHSSMNLLGLKCLGRSTSGSPTPGTSAFDDIGSVLGRRVYVRALVADSGPRIEADISPLLRRQLVEDLRGVDAPDQTVEA